MSGEPRPDDDDALAAELVIGLLDGAERAAALRRVLADRSFAGRVERWRERLGPLVDLVPAVAPPPQLLPRIEAALDGVADPVRLQLWRAATLAASAVAATLLVFVAVRPPPAPVVVTVRPGPVFVARIESGSGAPIQAVYDPLATELRLTPAALGDARHSAEAWLIDARGRPHALGLLTRGRGSRLTLARSQGARIAAGATLAISIEPLGGSPTGLPTGPVVGTGTLSLV